MAILSTRQVISFSASIAAASGIIVQATYTVPNGKRAILRHSQLEVQANGAAAGTNVGPFTNVVTAPGGRAHRLQGAGVANAVYNAQDMHIELASGDQVTVSSHNTSAVIVSMAAIVFIEEFN